MRLTGPNVNKLELAKGKSEQIIFDDSLSGFGVRLRSGGKRVWVAQYRLGTKQRRVTIGSVDAVSADKARAAAKEILAKAQLGADPQSDKIVAREKAAITLGSVADQYINGPARDRLRPSSYASLLVHLRTHWKPLRERPLHKIKRADIALQIGTISEENGPFAANRARASLSSLFTWAMREGIAEANPVAGTNKAVEEVSRDRVLSDREVALVWQSCRDDDFGRIVRLLILTGQRREEVGAICWSEIVEDKALWRLPKIRTKNGLPHDVPLSHAALMILATATRNEDRDFVFGQGAGSFSGWSKAKAALDDRIKNAMKEVDARGGSVKELPPWRLHDLRRTAATRMHDLGVLPHVVEAVLNHASGHRAGVAGIYNRALYSTEKRSALELWAEHLIRITVS